MPPVDRRDPAGRTLNRGHCFLYVAPSAYEDLLKLGFSRDPLVRLQALHPRFFEVFDFDRALLVETETVRDARALELRLRRVLVEYNAPAPLIMRAEAAGHTEWYRGAYRELLDAVHALAAEGHAIHAPAKPWFASALEARAELLYSWTLAMLSPLELDAPSISLPHQRAVRDAIDAYAVFGIDPAPWLPTAVLEWHRAVRG